MFGLIQSCQGGTIDRNKKGDALAFFCKSEKDSNIFYEGVFFGIPYGKILSYDLPTYKGFSKIATYLATVDSNTGRYIATFHQMQILLDGFDTAVYLTDGKSNQIGKILFSGEEYQEISGTVSTKILGQVVYNISDANRLGFK